MSMSISRAVAPLVAVLALAAATPAAAGPGNGIRLGGSEGRLHPFLELDSRYDTNVYYTADQQSVGDMVVHVRPGFELEVPGDLAQVQLSGNVDWAQYLGTDDAATKDDLSKLYGQAQLGLTLNRRGAIGLELDDEFRRSQGSSALVFGGAVISNFNALRVRAPWRPGGGALVVSLDGAWLLESFEPFFDQALCDPSNPALCDPSVLDDLGYNELRGGAEVRWRFLPRTSAVFELGYFSRVPNDTVLADDVSGLKVVAGATGLVTPHLGATVKAGYGDTLGSAEESFGTWLATVEGEWLPTEFAKVKLGYNHGFGVDPGRAVSVYASDSVQLGGRILLAGRYALRVDGSWERRAYELANDTATADLLRVEPSVEVAVSRWMTAALAYAYTDRSSDFPAGTPAVPGLSYSKSETWLRLGFRY